MADCTCDCHKTVPHVAEEDHRPHKVGLVAGFMSVAVFSLFSYTVWMVLNGVTASFDEQGITLVWVIVNTLGNFMSATLGYLFGVKVANNTPKMQGRR